MAIGRIKSAGEGELRQVKREIFGILFAAMLVLSLVGVVVVLYLSTAQAVP